MVDCPSDKADASVFGQGGQMLGLKVHAALGGSEA
jgi:hypothetical protein